MAVIASPISLYEQDLLLWTEATIRHLKAKNVISHRNKEGNS